MENLNDAQMTLLPEVTEETYFSPTTNRTISFDGINTSFFLFQFARTGRKRSAETTIRTVTADGGLTVLKLRAETFNSEDSDNKKAPAGLPGAQAQDVLVALMDIAINKEPENTYSYLESNSGDSKALQMMSNNIQPAMVSGGQPGNKIYFRLKDIAKRLGISEKNSRISEAIEHLSRTRFTILGAIYHNGQMKSMKSFGNYVSSVQIGKRGRSWNDEESMYSVELNSFITQNILNENIARADKEKYRRLPSGPLRKIHLMLSAKAYSLATKVVTLTHEEILGLTQITPKSFANSRASYFQKLIDEHIITHWEITKVNQTPAYVFFLIDEFYLTESEEIAEVKKYLNSLALLSKREPALYLQLQQPWFDLTEKDLVKMIIKHPQDEKVNGRTFKRAILWADMIIEMAKQGVAIQSLKSLLKHLLEKGEAPDLKSKSYIPSPLRYFKKVALDAAQKDQDLRDRNEQEFTERATKQAKESLLKLTSLEKARLVEAFTSPTIKAWKSVEAEEAAVLMVLVQGIRDAMDLKDIDGLIERYGTGKQRPLSSMEESAST